MKIVPIIISMLGMATAPVAFAQGCCGGGTGTAHAGCPMGGMSATAGHEAHAGMQMAAESNPSSPAIKVFTEPVQAVYDSYITVQGTLAKDSLEGVSKAAAAMAKSIQGDASKALSVRVAEQAEALSKAKDLAAARDAFKNLSDSLIRHLASQKLPAGVYHVAYCPMAKASWIQTSKTVLNPYMGSSMPHCGQLRT
jgi:hypothetical protein